MSRSYLTPSRIPQQAYQERRRQEFTRMAAGPVLDGDTLIVPSDWYNAQAARFWNAHGFRWNKGLSQWERDVNRPHRGRRYPPQVWLERARVRFYQFWPTLCATCRHCGQKFRRANPYQYRCPACRQKERDRRERWHDRST